MGATNTSAVHVSDASFATEIEQADGLVLVDFWATWCGPCQIVAPILEQLAGEYAGKAKVAKVDVDANQRTAMRFNVRSIPSILFFKNGQHVATVVGADDDGGERDADLVDGRLAVRDGVRRSWGRRSANRVNAVAHFRTGGLV